MKELQILDVIGGVADDLVLEAKEAPMMNTKNTRPLRIALIAAAVVVLLAGTVLAATYKLWSPGLAGWFGADEASQDSLLDSGMTSLVDAEPVIMDNGLKLEVQQVLCDGQETIISVRYSAPEPGWFTWDNRGWATQFTNPLLTIGDTEFARSYSGFDTEPVTDTEAYMTLSFHGDCATLDGETVTLTLKSPKNLPELLDNFDANFDTINGAEDEAIIRNDPLILWEPVTLTWRLDMSTAISKELEGSFSGEYEGLSLTWEDVTLTPISIRFTAMTGYREMLDVLYPTGVVLTDGTTVRFNIGGMESVDLSNDADWPDSLSGYFSFDTVVMDLDSIAGVTFAAWANTPVDPEVGDITVFTLPLQ